MIVGSFTITVILAAMRYSSVSWATEINIESVQACVIANEELNEVTRERIAQCLGWENNLENTLCYGNYQPITVEPLATADEIRIDADNVSFYRAERSTLSGNVRVQQTDRVVNAQTAYIYRDAQSNQVTNIELLGNVRYLEPGRLMIARKVTINAQDKSGKAEDVLYRFNMQRHAAILPSWGQARFIERFANKDYLLSKATYTTCAPQDNAWHIEAEKITLDNAHSVGVARDAKLLIGKVPVLYAPYLSFPTSKERKSGFLIPTKGYSNVGGFDFSLPYYWNMAPNYDAVLTPHLYTRRGVMMGGQFRYLTQRSAGSLGARFLPNDHAYKKFIHTYESEYPQLHNASTDRWAFDVNDVTQLAPNLNFQVNYQQMSDDYFLQDFSTNLAILTERQLLREGRLSYTTDHWLMQGMVQSYQTLQPVNLTPVGDVYQRLPQLLAHGNYDDLWFNGNFNVLGQLDNFRWPNSLLPKAEGPRYYLNPVLSFPQLRPGGFFTPSVELVQNYYDMNSNVFVVDANAEPTALLMAHRNNLYRGYGTSRTYFSNTIPRYSVDTGLYFDRDLKLANKVFTQTLEPRLYYLNVPFRNQNIIPVFDSGYTIFNTDQLFRTNRFAGFDRIGDTNQLSYALTSRWLSEETGAEKASVTVGQIRYFKERKVQLCQSNNGYCFDSPETLGDLSPTEDFSPVAGRAVYHFNPAWIVTGDYVWDPATNATNNGQINFHYQPEINRILTFGYTYLVNGDITQVAYTDAQNNPLHQARASFAWPFSEKWSALGAFSYNISKRYGMMSLFGVQYDNCCWATRLIGGRVFQSLDLQARPQYNNNIYLQVLLKGLGSVGNSDPASAIHAYIPGYVDSFHS